MRDGLLRNLKLMLNQHLRMAMDGLTLWLSVIGRELETYAGLMRFFSMKSLDIAEELELFILSMVSGK